MITFNRILFPVDLSEQCQKTAPFVAAMAARFGSELRILHVREPHLSYYPVPAASNPVALKREQEECQACQAEFESFVSGFFSGASIETQFAEGDVAQSIVSCAEDNKIDLIMMPTHGYGRFRRLLLGSVTAKVLHDTDCPVWTGVHTSEMWPQRGAEWSRFLCAVDANPRDVPLLEWAAQFACEQHADLQVVHAVHAAAPIPGGESDSLRNFLIDVARERLREMQAAAGTEFDIKLALGPVGCVVRDAALDHRADLVLIGRGAIQKGFGRLRSNAYAAIRESPCPVISR